MLYVGERDLRHQSASSTHAKVFRMMIQRLLVLPSSHPDAHFLQDQLGTYQKFATPIAVRQNWLFAKEHLQFSYYHGNTVSVI